MKTTIFLASAILIMANFFAGCSKESPVSVKQDGVPAKNSNLITVNNSAKSNPVSPGSINGLLFPVPAKAVIQALNDHYVSDEVIAGPDGSFSIPSLPPDAYHLFIRYVPVNYPDYLTFKVYKVLVEPGQETSIGQINLPG